MTKTEIVGYVLLISLAVAAWFFEQGVTVPAYTLFWITSFLLGILTFQWFRLEAAHGREESYRSTARNKAVLNDILLTTVVKAHHGAEMTTEDIEAAFKKAEKEIP